MLSTSEDQIRCFLELYVPPHTIEKVKKLKDFAFMHFTERKYAEIALKALDGKIPTLTPFNITHHRPAVPFGNRKKMF